MGWWSWKGGIRLLGVAVANRGGFFIHSAALERHVPDIRNLERVNPRRDVRILCKEGRMEEALTILNFMGQQGIEAFFNIYPVLLQACIDMNDLAEGKRIHAHMIKTGFDRNIFLGNALINMYSKCGSLDDARKVFNDIPERNVVSWTAMIAGYAEHKHGEEALRLFQQMQWDTVKPDKVTFVSVLKACARLATLEQGKVIHAYIVKSGFESDVIMANVLIDMYAKCGSMANARQIFNKMPKQDVVSWNVIISGYAHHGYAEEALKLFSQMQRESMIPNRITLISALKACANIAALKHGEQIHAHIVENGFESDIFVGNTLIDMYAKCGSIKQACQVFEKMPKRDVVSWNAMIAGYVELQHGEEALRLLWQMREENVKPNKFTFVSALKACTSLGDLNQGKQIHAYIIKSSLESDVILGSTLVNMYAKCGSIGHACDVFNKIHKPDVVLCNVMIAGYVQHGHGEKALALFWQMQQKGMKPNKVTFISTLKACVCLLSLQQGKQIHFQIIKSGFESDVFVGSTLVDMYTKCGSIEHACEVFNKMPKRDVVSWNVMITGYAQLGIVDEALKLFWKMQQESVEPDEVTFVSLLNSCASIMDLQQGKHIHAHIMQSGLESVVSLGNGLVDMYAKCGSIGHARQVFDKMLKRDIVSWNTVIAGYAQPGHGNEALKLFQQMQGESVKPNKGTFISILKACSGIAALEEGKKIHSHIIQNGFQSDFFVGSTLVDMYAKCGSVHHARQAFDKLRRRDVVSWTAMIAAYAQHGQGDEALKLFQQMQQESVKPDKVTFFTVLNACGSLATLEQGKHIHAHIIKSGFELDVFMQNTLIDMYAKCGSMNHACQVFDKMSEHDVVSWNVLIAGYAQNGNREESFKLFQQMQQERMKPNEVTFVIILNVCANIAAMELGKQIHGHIIKSGFETDLFVANTLINMYVKCGSMEHACQVFDKMPKRNVVSWNTLIAGYAQHNLGEESLKLFQRMQQQNMQPDNITVVTILKTCAHLTALEQGKQIHAYVLKSGFELDVVVGNTLMDMYAKCGSLELAREVFEKMSKRDVVSWNVMISGYAQHGHGKEAIKHFEKMRLEGIRLNGITFVAILSSCSHAGLVDEGRCYFDSMSRDYGITPTVEHYVCMVDLFGRVGLLVEAEDFIKKMPLQPTVGVWMALLGACRIHYCVDLAKHVAECILELEPENAAGFVVLSNVFAAASRWDCKAKVRRMMEDKGVKKEPGCSYIKVNNQVHQFLVSDTSHPQTKEIYAELKRWFVKIAEFGYVFDTRSALCDLEVEQKEFSLWHHSEKLAIAFGLISMPVGSPIHIIKNLRVCGDCHTVAKFISKISGREIVVRDANRFHHFSNGVCSCGDYW